MIDGNATEVLREIIEQHAREGGSSLPKLSLEAIEGLYHYAFQFYSHGKYPEAIKFFRFLTLVDTQQKKHWMGLGACLQMQKEYEQAVHVYGVAAVLDPVDPYVHVYAADCFFALDRVEEGMKALDSAKKAAHMKKLYEPLLPELKLLTEAWEKRLKKDTHHG